MSRGSEMVALTASSIMIVWCRRDTIHLEMTASRSINIEPFWSRTEGRSREWKCQ